MNHTSHELVPSMKSPHDLLCVRRVAFLCLWVASAGCGVQDTNAIVEDPPELEQSLGTCPLPPAERGFVKWNPGHYISPMGKNTSAYADDVLNRWGSVSTVKGMQKGYFWRELEPTRANYVWDKIDADIARLASANKKLAIIINYKYQMSDTESSLPDYVLAFPNITIGSLSVPPYFEQGKPNDGLYNKGQHANFGHTKTRNRFKALLTALSTRYDSNPNVVSISFIETSTGADISASMDTLFLNGILDMERHAGCTFIHTPVFQNLNFPRSRLAEFTDNFKNYGLGLGGPDVFFDSLKDPKNGLGYNMPNQPKGVYHYYPLMSSIIPIGQQVHDENLHFSTRESMLPPPGVPHNLLPSVSVAKVYDFSKQQLKPNYMFWFVGGDAYGAALKARLTADGLPLLTACPSVYGGLCSAN